METVVWIIIGIVWFVFSALNKQNKQKKNAPVNPANPVKELTQKKEGSFTFKEIMEELRRQTEVPMQEQYPQQQEPVYESAESVINTPNETQIITDQQSFISPEEKKKSIEYQKYLKKMRNTEHDSDKHHLDQKILKVIELEEVESYNLNVKDLILAETILRRPNFDEQ